MSTFPITVQYSIDVVDKAMIQQINGDQIGKEVINVALLENDLILCIRAPKDYQKILELKNTFSNVARF